ncbi:cation/H(+) antiporter 15-like [Asparagus officinalis]|uniref:cation/H(+) antiporter 15-like n=1 Tax=Asparagus officinalis TaxID=4686 RepID=UPI00098DE419|nr:cation/H(+) antiporter 15-like [Asparagus officinalis]
MAHQVSMNLTAGGSILCFRATAVSSSGWWGGKGPTDFSLPLLLIQISLLFVATRLSHFLLRSLCLPSVVSQVIAGIIVGPSCLSRPNGPLSQMFPSRSYVHLNSITLLSFILYIFVVAVKTDLSFPRKSRRKALAISEASSLLLPLHLPLPRPLPPHSSSSTTTSPSAGPPSSNIVLFCLLSDLNLLASKIGRIAMNVSLLSDLQGIVLKAILSSLFNTDSHVSVKLTLLSLLSLAVLVLFILFVARPTIIWMVRRTPDGMPMNEGYLLAVVVTAMFCSLVGEIIGQHIATGAMILGCCCRAGRLWGRRWRIGWRG